MTHQAADIPAPRVVEQPWMSLYEWRSRHERQLGIAWRRETPLVFLGDSITEAWLETAELRRRLGEYRPLNLGIGGDQTQHLLWRIEQGTIDALAARLAVVLIGVNNLGNGYSPTETVAGIRAVVKSVRQKLPEATVLLLHVLPAGERLGDDLRRAILLTNERLPELAEPGRVELLDIGQVLLEADGSIAPETMEDFLHPTEHAYRAMTAAIAPTVERLLNPRTHQ